MSDNVYVCECCGGKVNPATLTCEYCGTKYKRDSADRVPRLYVETFSNPVRTFSAVTLMDRNDLHLLGPHEASKVAVNALTHELAQAIPSHMLVESEYDPEHMAYKVRGTIKLVEPAKVPTQYDLWRGMN